MSNDGSLAVALVSISEVTSTSSPVSAGIGDHLGA